MTDTLTDTLAIYVESARPKTAAIGAALATLYAADWRAPAALAEARAWLHKLAGSGGTMGFPEVSHAAAALDALLAALADGPPATLDGREQAAALFGYLQRLTGGLDPARSRMTPCARPAPALGARVIYHVEDDAAEATDLAPHLRFYGFEVVTFASVEALAAGLRAARPAVVLACRGLCGDLGVATRAVADLTAPLDVPVVVVSGCGDLDGRVEAYRAGIHAYFTKPVDVGALVDAIDGLTGGASEDQPRVLIVDDDAPLAAMYAYLLEQAGVVTEVVADPARLLPRLDELRPDLVLMDLHMPRYSGIELAAAIRQQVQYASMPIVFLSGERRPDQRMQAMSLGGDDFLHKPVQPDHLVAAVQARVQRSRVLRSLIYRDSLTGLLNHSALLDQLDREVARAGRMGRPFAFAMLDLDHFKAINDTHGHHVGDQVIKGLARLLRQRLRAEDTVGRYGGEEFAVLLPGVDGAAAGDVLDRLRETFAQMTYRTKSGEVSASFSCGIATFPHYAEAATLSRAADEALYVAKNGGRNRVAMV